jgi:hypothetical protein
MCCGTQAVRELMAELPHSNRRNLRNFAASCTIVAVGRKRAVTEVLRLAQADSGEQPWRAWGPLPCRTGLGTVREDYSEHGTAWDYFPHDHARSRAYRWNEDGMGGICDDRQIFCFALALWNGRDPILKERMFGLGGDSGNHGEDAKEYWWYLDSTPTHSWMRWRYHYPQTAFPYDDLVRVNGHRTREETEYELLDTGVFDEDRFWQVTVDYAKAGPADMCIAVTVSNRGPSPATVDVLRAGVRGVLRRRPDRGVPDRVAAEDAAVRGGRRPVPPADRPVRAGLVGQAPDLRRQRTLQNHPDWKDMVVFPEYFHGDNGAGLGAWHQTGWTALVVDLILTLRR